MSVGLHVGVDEGVEGPAAQLGPGVYDAGEIPAVVGGERDAGAVADAHTHLSVMVERSQVARLLADADRDRAHAGVVLCALDLVRGDPAVGELGHEASVGRDVDGPVADELGDTRRIDVQTSHDRGLVRCDRRRRGVAAGHEHEDEERGEEQFHVIFSNDVTPESGGDEVPSGLTSTSPS